MAKGNENPGFNPTGSRIEAWLDAEKLLHCSGILS